MLERGAHPLAEIQARLEKLKSGEGLLVVAPFLPSPLIEFLGSQGYATKVERGAGPDWLVYLWREKN